MISVRGLVYHIVVMVCIIARQCVGVVPVLLHAHGGGVARGVRVHGAHDGGDGWLLVVARRWVCHVHTQENHRLVEHLTHIFSI